MKLVCKKTLRTQPVTHAPFTAFTKGKTYQVARIDFEEKVVAMRNNKGAMHELSMNGGWLQYFEPVGFDKNVLTLT